METCTGPALQAAFKVMSYTGGRLLLFQGGVPSLGVGKIKNRENASLYGTDREYTLRAPEDPVSTGRRFSLQKSHPPADSSPGAPWPTGT